MGGDSKRTSDQLVIRGAREHNLQDVNLELPRDALIVFTGISGSGKSSLAFDTIYAEGQRRYVESLSSYARQFLGQMDKPDVDFIEGALPGDLHRPEVGVAQPPFDGGDDHRDLRLPAPALCPHRASALSQLRPRHRARPRSRSWIRCSPCRTARASRSWPPWSEAARASSPRCWKTSRGGASSALASTARCGSYPRRSASTAISSTTSTSWSIAS